MKTLVLVNTLTSVNSFVYSNHIHFFTRWKQDFPNDEIIFLTPHRMSIDMARNMAAKQAMSLNCDYLLFLDDDVLVPPDSFKRLHEADKDVIAGLVIIRGFPFEVMAFKESFEEKDGKIHKNLTYYTDLPKDDNGDLIKLVSCGAVGFSLCLIKMDVIKALEEPYFITLPNCTEDVYFCDRIKNELSPEPEIFMDTSIQCGHLMNPEPVEWQYREKFRDFYFEWANMVDASSGKYLRDEAYMKKCIANLK